MATDRLKLSQLFHEMAVYLELLGENPFKARAHENVSRIIEIFEGDFDEAVKTGSIGEVKGIGPALKEKIEEFCKTGKLKEHEKLQAQIPAGLLELLRVPGLGPKKVKAIYDTLKITSLGELEYACKENRLVNLPGFGEKTQAKILKNIDYLKKYRDSFLYADAVLEAQILIASLKTAKAVKKIEVAGSLRRKKEIVKDIDILVATNNPKDVAEKFIKHPSVESVTGSGPTKTSVVLKSGLACDLRVVTEEEYPYALVYFTGSKEHNIVLRQIAKEKDLLLNEYGLFKGKKLVPCKTEADVYESLGLKFVEPELRENMGEIESAKKNTLPILIEQGQLKGIFHCHTTESDGNNSLEDMVASAQRLGFEYIGISDHSKSAGYANGLKKERVLEQFAKIESLQKKFKIKIFKGIESDILIDGELDYEDSLLKKFDFVIGSVHGSFNMTEEQMTKRILKAFKSPYLDILGHPTGRLLLARDSFPINMPKVIEEASKVGVIIELNASPQRLDVDWRLGKCIKEMKAKVSINPDAHSIAGLEDVEYGINMARKGWLTPSDVVNTLSANKILGALRRANTHA